MINICPECDSNLATSVQVRNGKFKPYPKDFMTCCNPTCRLVVNTETGEIYKRGKKC